MVMRMSLCLVLFGAVGNAASDVVVLGQGGALHGEVVKQDARNLWIDVGPTIVKIDNNDVVDVRVSDPTETGGATRESIFHTIDQTPELSIRQQAARVKPSVVLVKTPSGTGSGVIVNEEGHVVTNAHVIQGEKDLRLVIWSPREDGTLARRTIEDIEIEAVNDHLDLALLKLPSDDGEQFPWVPLEAWESIEVGQPVFAIGNPLGLEQTTSQGVVSTTQRSFDGLTYIQTDAAINPGNSGGPLFNVGGEVVGITNMGILGGEALGFAIPTRYVKDFLRNREAFSYDASNPNTGHRYHTPPPRLNAGTAAVLEATP
ncbi:MAG: trypsin-like peptidase domain-containing protein [Phycisphaerales bacterium]|jgi:serine protease Do|nr:trypsin-like peptidase domain-containing protein [Phycisphaerales bacterium]